jgi:hypothetical protein
LGLRPARAVVEDVRDRVAQLLITTDVLIALPTGIAMKLRWFGSNP